jgi:dCMP deaminase
MLADAGVEIASLQELQPESADWSAELAQFIENSTHTKAAP